MPNSLAIIGAGRVGRALGRQLREAGWRIGAVLTRSEASARRAVRFIGAGKAFAGITRQVLLSQVILIATPDDEIVVVARELARIGEEELRGRVILHTSGAMDSGALEPLRAHGATVGSMHPLQSFSGVAVPSLEGRVFAIEGQTQAVRVARRIARELGGSPVRVAGDKKLLYHAAAAMAAGHILAVEEAATQVLLSLGMKRREAVRALLPLTRQVLDNFETLGPRAAWTGPLSRGDFKVVRAHLQALRRSPKEFVDAYDVLNHLAARALADDATGVLSELKRSSLGLISKAKATGGGS
ncbi:MAG: hypothetical protein AUH11_01525 [Acidobacteria bacterium 13_2_20CM_57_17]|nr:MAG: hypothetical protein AUH11_01525 [Acidobacteria bacterium 13_2_20CM_57_17]